MSAPSQSLVDEDARQTRPVPSLLSARVGDLADIGPGTVALAGVYCDHFGGGAPGGRFAPRQLRYAEWPALGGPLQHIEGLVDVGDLNVYPLDAAKTAESLTRQARAIRATGARALFVSGDYSTTPALFRGAMDGMASERRGLIRISRSANMQAFVAGTNLIGRECTTRMLVDELRPSSSPWLLLLGSPLQRLQDYVALQGLQENVLDLTLENFQSGAQWQSVLARFQARCDGVYLSLDVDVLSPGVVHSGHARSMDGVSPDQLLDLLRSLATLPVLAADLTGFVPEFGVQGRMDARVVAGLLAGMADVVRGGCR
jgi:agmatinase